MTTKTTLQALLIGILLAASSAFADSAIEVTGGNGGQVAKFSLGDSKCVLVNEVSRCAPVLVAAN